MGSEVPDALFELSDGNHHRFVAVVVNHNALIAELEGYDSVGVAIGGLEVAEGAVVPHVGRHDTGHFNHGRQCNGHVVIGSVVLEEGHTGFYGLGAGVANLSKYIHFQSPMVPRGLP